MHQQEYQYKINQILLSDLSLPRMLSELYRFIWEVVPQQLKLDAFLYLCQNWGKNIAIDGEEVAYKPQFELVEVDSELFTEEDGRFFLRYLDEIKSQHHQARSGLIEVWRVIHTFPTFDQRFMAFGVLLTSAFLPYELNLIRYVGDVEGVVESEEGAHLKALIQNFWFRCGEDLSKFLILIQGLLSNLTDNPPAQYYVLVILVRFIEEISSEPNIFIVNIDHNDDHLDEFLEEQPLFNGLFGQQNDDQEIN